MKPKPAESGNSELRTTEAQSTEPGALIDKLLRVPDGERRKRLRVNENREQTVLDLVEQARQLTMVNAQSAQDAAALVVAIADELGSPRAKAQARRVQVRALSYAGQYDEALAVGEEGVRIAMQEGLTDEAGRLRLATMHALTEAGRLQEAIATGETARNAFTAAGEAALAARAEINLGVVHQRRDAPAEAVACFDRAWPALQDDPLTLGHLQNNRGEALVALNDFLGAERAFAIALDAFEQAGAELTAAIALGNLADLAMRNGRFNHALRLFEQARRRFEKARSPGHLTRILAEQAEAKMLIGMLEDARRDYETALKQLDECNLPLESSRARSGLGLTLIRLGRWSEAETALAAAATGFAELGHQTARAWVDLHRAELAARQGRLSEARSMAIRSLSILDGRPVDAVAARHVMARTALAKGDADTAGAELTAALATARRYMLLPLTADLLVSQGDWHRQCHRIDEAIECWHEAIDAIERIRNTLQARRFRTAFLGGRTAAYEQLVGALLDRNTADDLREAFAVVERCKCRSLSERDESEEADLSAEDHAGFSPNGVGSQQSNDPAVESSRLRAELNGLYSRLADDRASKPSPDEYEQMLLAIRETEHALRGCEARVEAVRGRALETALPVRVDELQRSLREDDAVVEYFAVDGSFIAFVVDRDHVHVERLEHTSDIEALLTRLQFQIDRALRPGAMDGERTDRLIRDARRVLRTIHDALILPLEPHVREAKRLLIVPHGALHSMPFAALYDGQTYLIDRYQLRTAPNATLIAQSAMGQARFGAGLAAQSAEPAQALIVSVGDSDAPQIEREYKAIAAALADFDIDLLVDRDATAERVCDRIERADLLHFACHGEFSQSLPFGSGLKLADRWLTARDLAGRRLRAQLVVLSACESGRSAIEDGDELVGLLRGFFGAGAGAVLVSQWRVHDQSSLDFMRIFYESSIDAVHFSATHEWDARKFDAAVRTAMCELRKQVPHPAFWAAFQLAGGAR